MRSNSREHLAERDAQLPLDRRLRRAGRQRRHHVLEARQFGDQVGRQQVGADAEGLAELDEGGPEFLERLAEALGGRAGRRGAAPPRKQASTEGDRALELQPRHDVREAVLHQDGGDLPKPAPLLRRERRSGQTHRKAPAQRPTRRLAGAAAGTRRRRAQGSRLSDSAALPASFASRSAIFAFSASISACRAIPILPSARCTACSTSFCRWSRCSAARFDHDDDHLLRVLLAQLAARDEIGEDGLRLLLGDVERPETGQQELAQRVNHGRPPDV